MMARSTTYPMQRLQVELIRGLRRHELHRRPLHRFSDRFSVTVKLYEYKYLGERSNIIRGRSILSRLDLLLPEIALPIRLYEFRKSQGGKFLDSGSRETSLSGLRRRLNNTTNVEDGFLPICRPSRRPDLRSPIMRNMRGDRRASDGF
jgi:hypothetical protein